MGENIGAWCNRTGLEMGLSLCPAIEKNREMPGCFSVMAETLVRYWPGAIGFKLRQLQLGSNLKHLKRAATCARCHCNLAGQRWTSISRNGSVRSTTSSR